MPQNDEPFRVIILDKNEELQQVDTDGNLTRVNVPNPQDLQGRYYISLLYEIGIAELLEKHLVSQESDPWLIKFKVKCDKERTHFE